MYENLGHEALIQAHIYAKKAIRKPPGYIQSNLFSSARENCVVANKFYRKAGKDIQVSISRIDDSSYSISISGGHLPEKIINRLREAV